MYQVKSLQKFLVDLPPHIAAEQANYDPWSPKLIAPVQLENHQQNLVSVVQFLKIRNSKLTIKLTKRRVLLNTDSYMT